jgi:hypothetical protein
MDQDTRALSTASLIAGLALALMAALAAFGNFVAIQPLSSLQEMRREPQSTSLIPRRCSDGASPA